MSSTTAGSSQVDQAREVICHQIAGSLNAGRFAVRVRINTRNGQASEARFYSHGDQGWQNEAQPVTSAPLVRGIEETLAMLTSKGHGDEWSIRHNVHADGHETDIRFHREKLSASLGDGLAKVLDGVLFRDQHDSRKDSRRSIRTPHAAGGSR